MTPPKSRTLVVGSTGFLGSTLVTNLPSAIGMDRNLLDLSNPISASAANALKAGDFQFIVICAAITDVEKCFKDRELSNRINVSGTIELLNVIRQTGAIPVFFSSDYVFANRPGPHSEDAPRVPETIYGKQKLEVEQYLEKTFQRYLIFRTSKLISKSAHPRNILFQVVQDLRASKAIRAFEDQYLDPVFVEDIARVVDAACTHHLNGTYNLGTRRIFTRDELARFLAVSADCDPTLVQAIKITDLNFSERRPNHNTLDCSKIEMALGFRFTEVAEGINELVFRMSKSE